MTISKKLTIAAVITGLASCVIYSIIFYKRFEFIYFEYLLWVLVPARALLILCLSFIVGSFVCLKKTNLVKKVKRFFKVFTVLVILISFASVCIGNLNYYNGYTPKHLIEANEEYIQKLFPYHEFNYDETKRNNNIIINRIGSNKFIFLSSYGECTQSKGIFYDVLYLESMSPFMNLKFNIEKGSMMWLVFTEAPSLLPESVQEIEVDGVRVKIFVSDNRYIAFINGCGKSICATLDYIEGEGITPESFAAETAKQLSLLEKAMQNGMILE